MAYDVFRISHIPHIENEQMTCSFGEPLVALQMVLWPVVTHRATLGSVEVSERRPQAPKPTQRA